MAALIAACAGAAWYQARAELRQLRIGELTPIAALLNEDHKVLLALQTESAPEKESGVLASYLAKIRAAGVGKDADMKQQLDQLVENNAGILALILLW